MRSILSVLVAISILAHQAFANTTLPANETLEKFVGDWNMNLLTHKDTFGDRGGPGNGTMTCKWGLADTWVDCELDSVYVRLDHYVLKIVLYRIGKAGTVGAFVTNSFGGGRLCIGDWASDNELVFEDAWIDPQRKWEHQITTYTFHSRDKLDFMIEVSKDGETYLPHSSGVYTRKTCEFCE